MFALTTGRTGTVTLSELLGLSSQIAAHHEPPPTLLQFQRRALWEVREKPQVYRKIFIRARGVPIGRVTREGRHYAETSGRFTFLAPIIRDLMPNAVFAFQHRHPAAIVRSGMRRGWYESHGEDHYRIIPSPGSEDAERWESWSRFERVCWNWAACNGFAVDFMNETPPDRLVRIDSGNLYAGDRELIRSIFALLGVEVPPAGEVARVLSTKSNEQVSGEFPIYEEWTSAQRDTLARFCGDVAGRLGYRL